jgi:hypothetical protein
MHLRSLFLWQSIDERGNRSLFSQLLNRMYFTSTTNLSILGTGRLLNRTVVDVKSMSLVAGYLASQVASRNS